MMETSNKYLRNTILLGLVFTSLTALALGLVVTSCQKNEDFETPSSNFIETSFQGSESTPKTKVSYTENNVKYDFSWHEGDKVSLIVADGGTDNTNNVFTAETAANSSKFTGVVTSWNDTKNVYSVFPYKTVAYTVTGGGTLATATVNITTIGQTIDVASNKFKNGCLVASVSGATPTNLPALAYKQVMSFIKFNITDVPTDEVVTDVTLSSTTADFISSADVLFNDGTATALANASSVSATVTGATANANTEVNLALFPVNLSSKEITITVTTDKDSYIQTQTGRNFARNTIYKAGVNLIPPLPITANCFIVAPSSSVTVPINNVNIFWGKGGDGAIATDMGSTWSTPNANAPAISANLITDDSYVAEVIWSDIPGGASVTFAKTATNFTVSNIPATASNIVVGVKKAGAGNTDPYLWSWHLWVTDFNPATDAVALPSGLVAMDRNLGATDAAVGNTTNATAVGALGLIYQWGRKDPFPNSSALNANTLRTTYPTLPAEASGDIGTLLNVIEKPNVFYGAGPDVVSSGHLARNKGYNRWGGSSNHTTLDKTKSAKSIYDPCPEGWRMPWGQDWSGFTTSNTTLHNSDFSTHPGRTYTNGGKTIWFPAAGFRWVWGGEINSVGEKGFYANGSPHSTGYVLVMHFDDSSVTQSGGYAPSWGFSVRPVKDN